MSVLDKARDSGEWLVAGVSWLFCDEETDAQHNNLRSVAQTPGKSLLFDKTTANHIMLTLRCQNSDELREWNVMRENEIIPRLRRS